jgi:hypothetical protein
MMLRRVMMAGAGTSPGLPPNSFSGNTLWLDFTDISTLYQDTAGTTPVTTDGQNIRRAVNKGSVSTAFVQSLSGNTYKTGLVNGKAGNRVGSNDLQGLSSSNFVSASAKTLMVVAKVSSVVSNNANTYSNVPLIGDGGGNFFGLYAAASPDRFMAYNWDGSDDHADNNEAQGSFVVVQYRHGGGSLQIRVNNDSWTTVSSGNTTNLVNLLRVGIAGGNADYLHAVAYNVALSDTDADQLRDWGLTEIGL